MSKARTTVANEKDLSDLRAQLAAAEARAASAEQERDEARNTGWVNNRVEALRERADAAEAEIRSLQLEVEALKKEKC